MNQLRANDGPKARIAILGGGCSGITAAYRLHKKGYRNVTLYEACDRLGGKVHSVTVDGHALELGMVITGRSNVAVRRMVREIGLPTHKPFEPPFLVDWKKRSSFQRKVPVASYFKENSLLAVARGFLQFWRVVRSSQFRNALGPGFYEVHADLVNLTMAEFARKYKFQAILDPVHVASYACGYGGTDEMPALYVLKFMTAFIEWQLLHKLTFNHHRTYIYDGGNQSLWEKVNAYLVDRGGLDLRLGSSVTSVLRRTPAGGQPQIAVTAGGETREYDRLFVTTSPDQTLKFLDATDEERELFGRVSYFNFHAVIFRAVGMNENELLGMPQNMMSDRDGHLLMCFNTKRGSNLFTGYQYNNAMKSDEELDELLRSDVRDLGGRLVKVVARKAWKYFPHVKHGDLDAVYYPRLNALQGKLGTYYLGPLFAFETAGHCAEFAESLVNKHDLRPPATPERLARTR
jgi:predicted NAD/FAD-binding protein